MRRLAFEASHHLQAGAGAQLHQVGTQVDGAGEQTLQAAVEPIAEGTADQHRARLAQQPCGGAVGTADRAGLVDLQQTLHRRADQFGARVKMHQQSVAAGPEQAVLDRRGGIHYQGEDVEPRRVVKGGDVQRAQALTCRVVDRRGDTEERPHVGEKVGVAAHQVRQALGQRDRRCGGAHASLGQVHALAAGHQQAGRRGRLLAQPVDHHAAGIEQHHRATGAAQRLRQSFGLGPCALHPLAMTVVQLGQHRARHQLEVDALALAHAGVAAALPGPQQWRFVIAWLQPRRHPVMAAHGLQTGLEVAGAVHRHSCAARRRCCTMQHPAHRLRRCVRRCAL